jgi:hypothetical protein
MESFEIKRVANGVFHAFLNSRRLNVEIINGCVGYTGQANIYGIYSPKTGKVVWCGSLANAKKSLRLSVSRGIIDTTF